MSHCVRENRIACQLTARRVLAQGLKHGYRVFGSYLILWVQGRTRSSSIAMRELEVLREEVTDELKDEVKGFDFARGVTTWSLQPGSMVSTDKGVFVLSEMWIPFAQVDMDEAMSELRDSRWSEGRPSSR